MEIEDGFDDLLGEVEVPTSPKKPKSGEDVVAGTGTYYDLVYIILNSIVEE